MSKNAKRERREYHREWARKNRRVEPSHALQTVRHRRLIAVLRKLMRRMSPLEISHRWGVSRAYIYMLAAGQRKPVRMRETTAVRLEALLASERLAGEVLRLAA